MVVVYQDPKGLQVQDFLSKFENELKDKHVIYVVQTNLAEDNLFHRNTRNEAQGVNVKIGKSEGTAHTRLKSYTHMSSNYNERFKQSGVRVLYIQTFPKRDVGISGAPMVRIFETALKRALREKNLKLPQRGSEIFRVVPEELFEIIQTLEIEYNPEAIRVSERLGITLVSLVKDFETGEMELVKHPKYDEFMREFYSQRGINVDQLTRETGLFNVPKLQTISTQVGGSLRQGGQTYSMSGNPQQPTISQQQPSGSRQPSDDQAPQEEQQMPDQQSEFNPNVGQRRPREASDDTGQTGTSRQRTRVQDQSRIAGELAAGIQQGPTGPKRKYGDDDSREQPHRNSCPNKATNPPVSLGQMAAREEARARLINRG